MSRPVTFTITARETEDDPSIVIYHAVLEGRDGVWPETFGSVDQLQAYIRGVRSASEMLGHRIPEPEIPRVGV